MTDVRAQLRRLVDSTPAAELPALIAEIAGAHAAALTRLVIPPASKTVAETDIVTADELATRLKVPPSWVREKARAGEIPCIRAGHYMRFRLSEVLEALRRMPPMRRRRTERAVTDDSDLAQAH